VPRDIVLVGLGVTPGNSLCFTKKKRITTSNLA
jgi:hypothetical protein